MDRIYHWNWPFFSRNLRAWLAAHQKALCLLYDATWSIREEGPVSRRLKPSKRVCVGGENLFSLHHSIARHTWDFTAPQGTVPWEEPRKCQSPQEKFTIPGMVLHTSNSSTRRLRQEVHEFEFDSPAGAEKLFSVNKYTSENQEMGKVLAAHMWDLSLHLQYTHKIPCVVWSVIPALRQEKRGSLGHPATNG